MKYVLLISLLLVGFVSDSFSQSRNSPIRLSLTAGQMGFRIAENTKVKLTFENKTGKAINSVNDLSVSLILERTSVRNGNCGWDGCYMAFFSPESKAELPNRGLFETEVDLTDLNWVDMIDSNSRRSREKNFFTTIAAGNFNLKAQLHHSLDLWAEDDPRFEKIIESNRILITIETEKKYRNRVSTAVNPNSPELSKNFRSNR